MKKPFLNLELIIAFISTSALVYLTFEKKNLDSNFGTTTIVSLATITVIVIGRIIYNYLDTTDNLTGKTFGVFAAQLEKLKLEVLSLKKEDKGDFDIKTELDNYLNQSLS